MTSTTTTLSLIAAVTALTCARFQLSHDDLLHSILHASVQPTHLYPSITSVASPQSPYDFYNLPISDYPAQELPPAHVLQYLPLPLPAHPSLTSSHPYLAPPYTHSLHVYSQPSSHIGALAPNPRAVIIEINYFNQKGELRQSCRGARNFFVYLIQVQRYQSTDIILLTDDQNGVHGQPTRKNILNALSWVGQWSVAKKHSSTTPATAGLLRKAKGARRAVAFVILEM